MTQEQRQGLIALCGVILANPHAPIDVRVRAQRLESKLRFGPFGDVFGRLFGF